MLHVKRQDGGGLSGAGGHIIVKSKLNNSLTEVGKTDALLALEKIKAGMIKEVSRGTGDSDAFI